MEFMETTRAQMGPKGMTSEGEFIEGLLRVAE